MFGFKNKKQNDDDPQNPQASIQNVQVFTMNKDLEDIAKNQPIAQPNSIPPVKQNQYLTPNNSGSPFLSDNVNSSPFQAGSASFSQNQNQKIQAPSNLPISQSSDKFQSKILNANKTVPKNYSSAIQSTIGLGSSLNSTGTPNFKSNETTAQSPINPIIKTGPTPKEGMDDMQQKQHAWGKLVFISIIIFTVLIFAALGYYWMLTRETESQIEKPPVQQPTIEKTTFQPSNYISPDKPNPLNIDINNFSPLQAKETLNKTAQKVVTTGYSSAVEFVIKDSENTDINFIKFADKIGIKLPSGILETLDTKFSFYIYNDQGISHFGLAINIKDAGKLNDLLASEHSNLPSDFSSIFPESIPSLSIINTGKSSYGGAEIRFVNIHQPDGKYSVDYSIYKEKLLIGTSKMTIRGIIDYINGQAIVNGVEDIIE